MNRRSKFELYESIICTLANQPLTIDSIAFECCTDCSLLKDRLDFLVLNGIAAVEVTSNNRALYLLTNRGLAISKTVALTRQLKKLQIKQRTSVQVLQQIPIFVQEDEET